MNTIHDLIIIGSGPAGLAAAIYAQRAELDSIVIEKSGMSGGQVLTTYEVDNYPGLPGANGFDLGMNFRSHADTLGAVFVEDEVQSLEKTTAAQVAGAEEETELYQAAEISATDISADEAGKLVHKVVGAKGVYYARTVILATGATHRKLGVPGEEKLTGSGVSYCATCDGAFFKNKTTAVIGGGDVALEDAIFLARMCEKVYVIHRRDEFRGAKSLQKKLMSMDNVEIIWDSVVEEIQGQWQVSGLKLRQVKTEEERILPVQGVFVAVGISPNSGEFEGTVDMERGYIKAGEDGKTSEPGIFAAGDIRTKQLRQIITAAADGANAVTSVERYLTED